MLTAIDLAPRCTPDAALAPLRHDVAKAGRLVIGPAACQSQLFRLPVVEHQLCAVAPHPVIASFALQVLHRQPYTHLLCQALKRCTVHPLAVGGIKHERERCDAGHPYIAAMVEIQPVNRQLRGQTELCHRTGCQHTVAAYLIDIDASHRGNPQQVAPLVVVHAAHLAFHRPCQLRGKRNSLLSVVAIDTGSPCAHKIIMVDRVFGQRSRTNRFLPVHRVQLSGAGVNGLNAAVPLHQP